MRNIRQNLFLAFVYNAVGVPVAAGILYPFIGVLISPIWASAAMTLSSVSVIGNALAAAELTARAGAVSVHRAGAGAARIAAAAARGPGDAARWAQPAGMGGKHREPPLEVRPMARRALGRLARAHQHLELAGAALTGVFV